MKKIFAALMLLGIGTAVSGTEYFVDYRNGKADSPGTKEQPLKEFSNVLAKLKAGDTVRILPAGKPIRDNLRIGTLCGTQEKPVVIDGMNNIFIGSQVLAPQEWKEVKPGLFCRKRQTNSGMMSRYYMIHKGSGVFMGRAVKGGVNPKLKAPEALVPGEWTFIDREPKNSKPHLIECYVRLGEGEKTPADGAWEEPSRISGVQISSFCDPKKCGHLKCGTECPHIHCGHIVFRNIIVKHFWNDGFNIHGKARNIRFENIAAVECGDDGLSAHENTQIAAKNYVSLRNSTCICHIQQAECSQENVYAEGSRGVDFFPCDRTQNILKEVFVRGNSRRGVVLDSKKGGAVTMKKCVFFNTHPKAVFDYAKNDSVKASFEDVQIAGYRKACQAPGIGKGENLPALLQQKKTELFRIFGGQLEKADR